MSVFSSALQLLLCFALLAACQPQPVATPSPIPSPSALPTAVATPPASPVPVATREPAPAASAQPEASVAPAASLRLAPFDRFLTAFGQTAQLTAQAYDAAGQPLAQLPRLEWRSSQPGIIAVDQQGLLKALAQDGYATITAQVAGTDMRVSVLVNVTSGHAGPGSSSSSSSSGGGTSASAPPVNTPPTIVSLTSSDASVTGGGAIVRLDAIASDSETPLTDASYSWSCTPQASCGSFSSTSGTRTYWTSPASGTSQIQLSVSDGSLSVQREVTIAVVSGIVNVTIN